MIFGSMKIERHIELEDQDIENVEEFVYLVSLVSWDNDCSKDIKRIELSRQPVHSKDSGKYGRAKNSGFKPRQRYYLYLYA